MNYLSNYLSQWKLGIHLIFQTKHFGVNNHWWSRSPSLFGINGFSKLIKIITIYPIIKNYQNMKWRMDSTVGFISNEEYKQLFS